MCVNTDVVHHSLSDHIVKTIIPTKFKIKDCINVKHDQKELRSISMLIDTLLKILQKLIGRLTAPVLLKLSDLNRNPVPG